MDIPNGYKLVRTTPIDYSKPLMCIDGTPVRIDGTFPLGPYHWKGVVILQTEAEEIEAWDERGWPESGASYRQLIEAPLPQTPECGEER